MDSNEQPIEPSISQPTGRDPSRPVHVDLEIDLAPGERIQITVEAQAGTGEVRVTRQLLSEDQPTASARPPLRSTWFSRSAGGLAEKSAQLITGLRRLNARQVALSERWFFALAVVLYLLTRMVQLENFPIYFHGDEAANTVLAADLLRNGLRGAEGDFLPTFFRGDAHYDLGVSVYLQVLPYLLFGKSIWATRGMIALLSLLAALWLAWLLRDHFGKSPYWWSAPLLLAITPAWFVFSRTAFESAPALIFYTGFLYYYLGYRQGGDHILRNLCLALVLAGLAFYSQISLQPALFVTGLVLLLSDGFYHWEQRRIILPALGVCLALALPLIRFWALHPGEYLNSLGWSDTHWAASSPPLLKWLDAAGNYLMALNPLYWFFPIHPESPLYSMPATGYLPWFLLPFAAWGIWRAIRSFRSDPAQRSLLLMLLAAPFSAALLGLSLLHALLILVLLLLFSASGLARFLQSIERYRPLNRVVLSYALWIALSVLSLLLLVDALGRGPIWNRDYGITGMQYGAQQVFGAANAYAVRNPRTAIRVSPSWSTQPERLRQFFSQDFAEVSLGSVDQFLDQVDPSLSSIAFLLTAEEYRKVLDSGKFQPPQVQETLYLPDGQAGFYLVRLQYRQDIERILAEEREARTRPVQEQILLDGQAVTISHSNIEGNISNLFDGLDDSLIKTTGANPLIVQLEFAQPRSLRGVGARVGAEAVRLTVRLETASGQTVTYTQEAGEVTDYKEVEVAFEAPFEVRLLRVELLDVNVPEVSIVHMWELRLIE